MNTNPNRPAKSKVDAATPENDVSLSAIPTVFDGEEAMLDDECGDQVLLPFNKPEAHDLESVLTAWQGATLRLERTHEALRAEVRRLTNELEIKNRELARKNRLADLGQMASHVAHEVRNNLLPVSLYLSLLRRRLVEDQGSMEVLDKVDAGLRALDVTVNDLLHFTAERDPLVCQCPLADIAAEIRESLQPQLNAQKINLLINAQQSLTLLADREMLRRALLNLVLNSLDAMLDGGQLVITGVTMPDGSVEIEVADNGPGLSDEVCRRAFEPFFTTKSNGTGLGLAIVYRMAEVHGGTVSAMNCPEGGAAFTLRLPQRTLPLEAAA